MRPSCIAPERPRNRPTRVRRRHGRRPVEFVRLAAIDGKRDRISGAGLRPCKDFPVPHRRLSQRAAEEFPRIYRSPAADLSRALSTTGLSAKCARALTISQGPLAHRYTAARIAVTRFAARQLQADGQSLEFPFSGAGRFSSKSLLSKTMRPSGASAIRSISRLPCSWRRWYRVGATFDASRYTLEAALAAKDSAFKPALVSEDTNPAWDEMV